MLFKDYLLRVLTNYQTEKETQYSKNKLADFIRNEPLSIDIISNLDSTKYKISASAGNGQWAVIPWLSIYDRKITESAQKGYYIVYLFTADLSGVYLSLNQGYTFYQKNYAREDPKKKIELVSKYWQANLPFLKDINGFNSNKINLNYKGTGTVLPKGYELGNIFSKFYSTNDLQKMSTDKALSQDLNYMITAYQELKESLYTTFDKVNAHIVKSQSLYKLTEKIENKKSKSVNKDMILIENPTQTPTNLEITKPKKLGNTKRKPDYINNLERNTKQGLEGEELVIKNQIDILSFKKDTKNEILEHYIEVKSTKSGIETPFFMSSNELEVARTKGKQYSIYRLYKKHKNDTEFNYYIINDPYNNIQKEPSKYKVLPSKNQKD